MKRAWLTLGVVCGLASCGEAPQPAENPGSEAQASGCADGEVRDGTGTCRRTCSENSDCFNGTTCVVSVGLCLPDDSGARGSPGDTADAPAEDSANSDGEGAGEDSADDAATDDSGGDASGQPDSDAADCAPGDCESPRVCAPNGAECVLPEGSCVTDSDCGFGQICDADSTCVSRAGDVVESCASDTDCGALMRCTAGICTGCATDLQCSGDARCVFSTCVQGDIGEAAACLQASCPQGQRCNPQTGQCEPTCEDASDCAASQICAPIINRCTEDFRCSSDGDCASGLSCTAGLCTGCAEDSDCGAGWRCRFSACFPAQLGGGACADVTCAQGESCDPNDGACYPEDGTCADDSDCRTGTQCGDFGVCVGGDGEADCRPGTSCVFQACVPVE